MSELQDPKCDSANCRSAQCPLCRPVRLLSMLLAAVAVVLLVERFVPVACGAEKTPPAKKPAEDKYAWKDLFDGKSLKGWKVPNFGGEGKVHVKDGAIVIDQGESMSGITYTGELPKIDYEVTLEGKRLQGSDFFCTTTFPVGDSHASLVVGGWGGSIVGISSIDHFDASENPTTKFSSFKDNQWYKVRIRVTKAKIEAWIGDEKMVDFEIKDHKISIRMECDLCRPLGVSTWCTSGAVRNIRLRNLPPEDVKAAPPEKK